MRIGLALPQYDFSVPGERPLQWSSIVRWARRAEELGFESVWLSDHLFLDIERHQGPSGPLSGKLGGAGVSACVDPIVGLGALAVHTSKVGLGTLTLCAPLRPATVLAKSVTTLDVLSGGRLVVGLGAGWYEPELALVGAGGERPGERLARLAEAVEVLRGMAGGGPFSFAGRYARAQNARCLPRPVQRPAPPIWLGGKGDRLLRLVASAADGWNTAWRSTPAAYRKRVAVLHAECERLGRDPASVHLSVGLYALVGEDAADLTRRFERLRRLSPPGVVAGATLDDWRRGGLVGTVDDVGEQLDAWAAIGVSTVVLSLGAVPFSVAADDDSETVAAACSLGPCPTSDPWN
ncbi:MAG: TIGR03619 family F420-dependent LLM class oxidoreductase [Actinomycetota bacterium]|nr:TIGR03619 family F420-dependent LLM class oxidoreductase [Actinomycetota bacterium]